MTKEELRTTLNALTEKLAAIEHERWSHWQRYLHSKGSIQPDGSLVITADLVARWEKQMATDYEKLQDKQKESDREQVRKYLPLIMSALVDQLE